MVTYFAFAIAGLVAIDDQTKEMPTAVKRYFEESERLRTERINELELSIKTRIANAAKQKGLSQQAKKAQGDEIAAMKKSLESLKKKTDYPVPGIMPSKFKVGQVGAITLESGSPRTKGMPGTSAQELRVLHIVNGKEMLVEPYWYEGPKERVGDPFWIKGKDTSGYTSNGKVTLDGVFQVSGTTSYDSQAGKVTVFVLEPLDVKPWLK